MNTAITSLGKSLKGIIKEAGALARTHFGTDLVIETKPDGSKVSSADYAVNHYLEATLRPLAPEIAWLSEESPRQNDRLKAEHTWIIDPIDGTSSFLNHEEDWCIAVALVKNGAPLLGAVYNPMRDELFFAQQNQGAFLNQARLAISKTAELARATIITSNSHFNRTFKARPTQPENQTEPKRFWRCSMAYRIALVAAGQAEATISLTPKNDWDIAASHLILEEAGGKISSPEGKPLIYNRDEITHNGVVATNEKLFNQIIRRTAATRQPTH